MLKVADFDEPLAMFDDGANYIKHVDTSGTYYERPSPSNLLLHAYSMLMLENFAHIAPRNMMSVLRGRL